MKTYKQFILEAEEKALADLKPSQFLGKKETWDNIQDYKNDLIEGIDKFEHKSITDDHKTLLKNLIENPDENCFRNTKFKKKSDVGTSIANKIIKDFGEAIGPIKILNTPDFLPWINNMSELYIPSAKNEPLFDYRITDKDGVVHKISAKTTGKTTNTVKPHDVLKIIEDALKNKSVKNIMQKLFDIDNVSENTKYKKEYQLLTTIFQTTINEKSPVGYMKVAAMLDRAYGKGEYANVVEKLEDEFFFVSEEEKIPFFDAIPTGRHKDYTQFKIPFDNPIGKNVKDLMRASDKLTKKYTSAPSDINKALKLLINFAFKNNIYFAKFGIMSNGKTVWETRGNRTDFSNLYIKNKSGFNFFTKIHLDSKGARGDEKIGLRIE